MHRPLPSVPTLLHALHPSPDRPRLEEGVRSIYAAVYGAIIRHFLPILLGLCDEQGALLGVIGAQLGADSRRMFLEEYLDEPVEQALACVAGAPVARESLAEVGNLAALEPGTGLLLVSTLAAYFEGAGVAWAVFTATRSLRAGFRRRGLELLDLGAADGSRLGARLAEWGSYYATEPRVTAVRVSQICDTLRRDEQLAVRCSRVWDAAFRQGRAHARHAA